MISDRLERDVSVLQETVSTLRDELRGKESIIENLHRQCESYESKFDHLQNVSRVLFNMGQPQPLSGIIHC